MTKPFDMLEQESHNWFRPKHRKAILFAQSKFDAVQSIDTKKFTVQQFYPDLPAVTKDCQTMRDCLKKFQIQDKDVIDLTNNPKKEEVGKVMDTLSKELREAKKKNPPDRYLIVFLFAGHGILRDGLQHLVYNEYNKREGFYHLFNAEGKIRYWSEIYPNAYLISLFACCRQIHDPDKMKDLFTLKQLQDLGLQLTSNDSVLPVHIPKYEVEKLKLEKAQQQYKKATQEFERMQKGYEEAKKEQETLQHEGEDEMFARFTEQSQDRHRGTIMLKSRISMRLASYFKKQIHDRLHQEDISRAKNNYRNLVPQNFLLIFGHKPGKSVSSDTDMVEQFHKCLMQWYDKQSLSIKVPQIFGHLKSQDAKFEFVQSPTLQPLKMILTHNIVTKKIAYVFINSECRGIPYLNAKTRGKQAQKLFDDIFEFKNVHTFTDLSAKELEDALKRIKEQARDFESEVAERNESIKGIKGDYFKQTVENHFKNQLALMKEQADSNSNAENLDHKNAFICINKILKELHDKKMTAEVFDREFARLDYDGDDMISQKEMVDFIYERLHRQEVLLIGVYWIGHCLNPKDEQNASVIQNKVTSPISKIDNTCMYPWYEVNIEGSPVCLNEHMIEVASGSNTHVILMDDYQDSESIKIGDLIDLKYIRGGRTSLQRGCFLHMAALLSSFILGSVLSQVIQIVRSTTFTHIRFINRQKAQSSVGWQTHKDDDGYHG